MKNNVLNLVIGMLLLIFIVNLQFVQAQKEFEQKQNESSKTEKYFKILDRLFYEEEVKQSETLSFVTIRFLPSFSPETQIIIVRKINSSKLIYFKASESIFTKLSKTSFNDLVINDIKIEKSVYNLKVSEADKLINDLNISAVKSAGQVNNERIEMLKSNTVETYLDGAFYLFWSESGLNKFHLVLYDENVNRLTVTGDFPLTIVSNTLRLNLEKGFFK